MTVDIVIVTYNSAPQLPELFAVLDGAGPVFVVDNASVDQSAKIAEGLGATVVRGEANAGFGAGANRGARLGSGELIVFLNPDAHITPADLKTLAEAFTADPRLVAASPTLRRPDGSGQRVGWPFPTARGAWAEALGLDRIRPNRTIGFVVGACFMVRRDAFEAVGGFDERFWLYGEETDLCRRLVDAGGSVGIVDDAVAVHVGGASGDGTTGLVPEHFIRGGEHFVLKHEGPSALVSYRLAQLVGSGVRGGLGLGARADEHRWRFRRTAAALRRHPTTVDLDSPATSARGKGLVVCSLEPWDEVWRRNQFLVRELLVLDPDRRILFVEPAFDVLHERRRGAGRRHVHGLRPLGTDGRIMRVEPLKLLPRRFGPLADRLRDRQVTRAAARLGFLDPALWINDPSYASLAAASSWPSLYDITDDWTEAGHARTGSAAARDEKRLFERCDAVVVCSAGLAATRRAMRDDLVVIPNAVDTDHLLRPRPRPHDLPPGDVAVYVGSLHDDRIDVPLVERLATELPQLTVLLVGPDSLSETSRARLRRRPNVVLAGRRPYDVVPAYLQHASVVIVPHRVTPFTESLDPIKLYESLALGRTTVATPVAGFRDAGDPVVVASGEAFVDAVRHALAERAADRPAAVASWADRAETFQDALTEARTGNHRRFRVVYYDHCARLSGGELALARLLPALRNVDPLVLLGEHGPLEDLLRDKQIPTEVLPLDEQVANTSRTAVTPGAVGLARLAATAHDVGRLAERLRELEPDLLHTNSLKGALLGGVAGRLAGVPVLWHVRDRIAADYMPLPAVVLVRAASLVLPSAVIANSASTRRTLGRRHRADVIGSPIVYDLVEATAHLRTSTAGSLRVAMVGRLAPWKGQDVFLEAFARAFPDGDEQAVLAGAAMFGEDAFEARLRARTAELGIADRVEFTGFIDDVHALLAGCDVLVHASVIAEPFGQVVIEGLAAGLPVIATDSGGPSEIITNGVDGLLCPPGDVGLLAELLRRLAHDPAERERLGAAGLQRAADFRPEVIAGLVEHSYRRILVR